MQAAASGGVKSYAGMIQRPTNAITVDSIVSGARRSRRRPRDREGCVCPKSRPVLAFSKDGKPVQFVFGW